MSEIYRVFFRHSDSFQMLYLGADLAYLMGAILNDNACIWPESRPSVRILRQHFTKTHPVWQYVGVEESLTN